MSAYVERFAQLCPRSRVARNMLLCRVAVCSGMFTMWCVVLERTFMSHSTANCPCNPNLPLFHQRVMGAPPLCCCAGWDEEGGGPCRSLRQQVCNLLQVCDCGRCVLFFRRCYCLQNPATGVCIDLNMA